MSYLSVLNNPNDAVRLRIINEPKRGIGDAAVAACGRSATGWASPCWK